MDSKNVSDFLYEIARPFAGWIMQATATWLVARYIARGTLDQLAVRENW